MYTIEKEYYKLTKKEWKLVSKTLMFFHYTFSYSLDTLLQITVLSIRKVRIKIKYWNYNWINNNNNNK